MVAGIVYRSPSAIRRIVPRRIFPDRVLGTDPVAHDLHDLRDDLAVRAFHACFQDDEADRQLPFELVRHADHRALGHVRVRGEDLLHRPGREAMAGDVDDVVGAGHDEDVVVLVDVAGVGGLVVAGKGGEVCLAEALVRVPERRRGARRHR